MRELTRQPADNVSDCRGWRSLNDEPATRWHAIAAQDHKTISRRFFEEVCSAGNLDVIDELVAADAVHRERDAEAR
jgi:hypothetical protein